MVKESMPNSKHRKRRVAANRRQLDKARKRLNLQTISNVEKNLENEKENHTPSQARKFNESCTGGNKLAIRATNRIQQTNLDNASWLGGLYGWCHSGILQVWIRMLIIM